jgi:hypothetical protein
VFVGLDQCNHAIRALRRDRYDMAREFPDHVAARGPCRQRKSLSGRSRVRYPNRNLKQMGVNVCEADKILNRCAGV